MDKAEFKRLRISKKYTQAQLAEAFGLSGITISYYEQGLRAIPETIITRLTELPVNDSAPNKAGRPKRPRPFSGAWSLGAYTPSDGLRTPGPHERDYRDLMTNWRTYWHWPYLEPVDDPTPDTDKKILWVTAKYI